MSRLMLHHAGGALLDGALVPIALVRSAGIFETCWAEFSFSRRALSSAAAAALSACSPSHPRSNSVWTSKALCLENRGTLTIRTRSSMRYSV